MKVRGQLLGVCFSLHLCGLQGSNYQIQIVSLSRECLYQLSHFTGLELSNDSKYINSFFFFPKDRFLCVALAVLELAL